MTTPNNNFKFPRVEKTKLMDISATCDVNQDVSRDAIRELNKSVKDSGLDSSGVLWRPNHNIGDWERVHHAGMYELDADSKQNSKKIVLSSACIKQFAPHQAMLITDLVPDSQDWYEPSNIGLNLIDAVTIAGKREREPIDLHNAAVEQLARIKSLNSYGRLLPDSPRDWAGHTNPKGFITVFINKKTLAMINCTSSSHTDAVFRSMMDNAAFYGIPIERQFVGGCNPAPACGTHQILPFVGHDNSGIPYYADAGWHILCAMNRLGFDVNRFKAVVHLRHKQKRKQGLYMTFKTPTFPSLEGLATPSPSSGIAMVKGDAVKIFQAALTAAR